MADILALGAVLHGVAPNAISIRCRRIARNGGRPNPHPSETHQVADGAAGNSVRLFVIWEDQ